MVLAEWAPLFAAGMLAYLARSDRRFWLPALGTGLLGALAAGILHDWAQAAIVAGVVLGFFAVRLPAHDPGAAAAARPAVVRQDQLLAVHRAPDPQHDRDAPADPAVGRWAATGITFVVVTLIAWGRHRVGEDYLSRRFKTVLKAWQKTVTAR